MADGSRETKPDAMTATDPAHFVVQRRQSQADYARLVPATRVKEFAQRSWVRPVVDTAVCWLLVIAAWGVVAWHPAWWTVLPAMVVVGNRFYALFIIGHDGLHRRLFKSRTLNDRFSDVFIFAPIGGITRLNNRNHLLHHAHLATDDDPDRHKYACFNKTSVLVMLGFMVGLTSVARSVSNVFFGSKRADRPERSSQSYRVSDVLLLGAWQLGLIVGLTAVIGWWAYPVLWLVPVYVFTVLGDNLRSFCEHSHPEADDLADQHRLITYHSPIWERWLISPMSMNYHTAHHLWPTIPYYHLRQADRELQAASDGTDLIWRRSYTGYLLRYFRALPLEACRASAEQLHDRHVAAPTAPDRRAA